MLRELGCLFLQDASKIEADRGGSEVEVKGSLRMRRVRRSLQTESAARAGGEGGAVTCQMQPRRGATTAPPLHERNS